MINSKTLKGKLKSAEELIEELKGIRDRIVTERDNIRKAYEESTSRDGQINDGLRAEQQMLIARLRNVEASAQQLSNQNGELSKLSRDLALEKDKLANALASMWIRFEELISKYHNATGHPETPGT